MSDDTTSEQPEVAARDAAVITFFLLVPPVFSIPMALAWARWKRRLRG